MHLTLTTKIQSYIQERYQTKLDEYIKKYNEPVLSQKKAKLLNEFKANTWLTEAAKDARIIKIATHAIKFIHSSAKGSNVLDQELGIDARFLDTQSLGVKSNDITSENAKALYVATLLQLTDDNGVSLLDYVEKGDSAPLAPLASSQEELQLWMQGLKNALLNASPSSHNLAKQVYFPIDESEYHLLLPLYPTSLSQAIHNEVKFARFSQEMKDVREARKKNEMHPDALIAYPNVAATVSGGSNKQNVSQLNSRRDGITYLFNAAPPVLNKGYVKQPSSEQSIFTSYEIYQATKAPIETLTDFFIRLSQRNTESNMRIRDFIERKVDEIIDEMLYQVALWQKLPAGWTDTTQHPTSIKRWLDPHNEQWDKFDDAWQEDVANGFADWLVARLNHGSKEQYLLGRVESQVWASLCKQALREASA